MTESWRLPKLFSWRFGLGLFLEINQVPDPYAPTTVGTFGKRRVRKTGASSSRAYRMTCDHCQSHLSRRNILLCRWYDTDLLLSCEYSSAAFARGASRLLRSGRKGIGQGSIDLEACCRDLRL